MVQRGGQREAVCTFSCSLSSFARLLFSSFCLSRDKTQLFMEHIEHEAQLKTSKGMGKSLKSRHGEAVLEKSFFFRHCFKVASYGSLFFFR